MEKKRERICLIFVATLVIWGLFASCAVTPLTAGLSGVIAGSAGTMYLDDDPDIIVDGENLIVQGGESNLFSLLETALHHWWVFALMWFLPSPFSMLKKRLGKKREG
jgi:hypothetical protein